MALARILEDAANEEETYVNMFIYATKLRPTVAIPSTSIDANPEGP
jgi:hypothetical protein